MTPGDTTAEPMISPLASAGAMCVTWATAAMTALLELWLRIVAVVDQVETVGYFARHMRHAIARGQRGAEFGFVGVGGFVQVDMQAQALAQRRDQAHERGRFLGRAVRGGTSGWDRWRPRSSD